MKTAAGVTAILLSAGALTLALTLQSACSDDAASGPTDASMGGDNTPSESDGAAIIDASTDSPVQCAADPCATAMAVGESFGCAIMSDRTVRCWGSNYGAQLARLGADGGPGPSSAVAVAIPGLSDVVEIGAGGTHVCARTGAGKLYCWGANYTRETSITAAGFIATPTEVALPATVARLTVGQLSTCAVLTDGRVFCWGYSQASSLGVGDASTPDYGVPVPAPMVGVDRPDLVQTYLNTTCVVVDGGVRCIGFNAPGVADAGYPHSIPEATPVALDGRVVVLSTGESTHVCVALDTGKTMCWGNNFLGQSAPTLAAQDAVLPQAVAVTSATAIDGAADHTCALSNGEVWCWGSNESGQLGAKAPVEAGATRLGPVRVDLPARSVAIGAGSTTSCALLETGAIHCWGKNTEFALGRGTAAPDADLVDPVAQPVSL